MGFSVVGLGPSASLSFKSSSHLNSISNVDWPCCWNTTAKRSFWGCATHAQEPVFRPKQPTKAEIYKHVAAIQSRRKGKALQMHRTNQSAAQHILEAVNKSIATIMIEVKGSELTQNKCGCHQVPRHFAISFSTEYFICSICNGAISIMWQSGMSVVWHYVAHKVLFWRSANW